MTSTPAMTDNERNASNAAGPASSGGWSDWVGVVASIGCAIHCAAMPFVIAYLPALGLSFLADEAFHQWMAVACFVIALAAFLPGLRQHGRLTPVIVASAGLVMISVAAFGFAGQCCAACAGVESTTASNRPAAIETETCTETACKRCLNQGGPAPAEGTRGGQARLAGPGQLPSASWAGPLVAWLTPLGGVVLVSAHLLNRRYGCMCGCCGDDPQSQKSNHAFDGANP